MIITSKSKGFTFLEILIASSIFTVIMVITFGVLGQSAGYQAKLKAQHSVVSDAQNVAEMITRETKKARETGAVKTNNQTIDFEGILILNCESYNCQLPTTETEKVNTLILSQADSYKIYFATKVDQDSGIYYANIAKTNDKVLEESDIFNIINTSNLLSKADNWAKVDFWGVSKIADSSKEQSFVGFLVNIKTKSYDNLGPDRRAKISIRSLVTARNY